MVQLEEIFLFCFFGQIEDRREREREREKERGRKREGRRGKDEKYF
jgi:hypothetical protein